VTVGHNLALLDNHFLTERAGPTCSCYPGLTVGWPGRCILDVHESPRAGTSVGNLVGVEYDRVNPAYPAPRPVQVLSHSPLVCNGARSFGDSAYYTHAGGAAHELAGARAGDPATLQLTLTQRQL
jgi:hypothetical protein